MAHLCDSGALEALTPDDKGILREWAPKYAVITDPRTPAASLSIYSSPEDVEGPEVAIPLEGSEVQISKQTDFERCFTVTTADGLRIFLRAASIIERDSWVESLKQAKGTKTSTGKSTSRRSQEQRAATEELHLRACGHVFLWDDAGQKWLNRYFYLSPGIINEFNRDFQAPIATHDLTKECAIRMRGSPPCVELKLGTGEVLKFFGKSDTETKEWFESIKTRATEPPQPFVDFARAAKDATMFEQDGGALSFYLRPDAVGDLMAGVPSSFGVVGAVGDPSRLEGAFTAFLTASDTDHTVKAKGTFHVLPDNSLSLRIVHHQQGRYPLHVQFRGKEVFGSPFNVLIHPAPPSPQHSLVTGQGLFHAPLPDSPNVGKFTIRLRDRYLNFCERIDPAQLKVHLYGPAVILHMIYVGDGATDVTYRTTNSNEEVQIEVTYGNVPLAGSPFVPSFEAPSYLSHDSSFSHALLAEAASFVGDSHQQQTALAMAAPRGMETEEQRATQEAVSLALQAVETTRHVTEKAEAVSAYISSKIRRDWAESNRQVDEVFPREEQLEILLASSSLRANGIEEEPAFLRKLAVAVETDRGQLRKWEAEPLPPPWASMSVVQAYVRRQRRDLQEAVQPLLEATKAEQNEGRRLEPVANWKRLLLDWPGAEKASIELLESFKTAISVSPLNHRQLIVAMCDAVILAEKDFARRRALIAAKNGGTDWLEESKTEEQNADNDEDSTAAADTSRPKGKLSGLSHREELRKRVQSVALGRNLQRPPEPLLLKAEPKVREKRVDRVERQNREEDEDRDEHDDGAEVADPRQSSLGEFASFSSPAGLTKNNKSSTFMRRHGSSASSTGDRSSIGANDVSVRFEVGDRVKVDGIKAGTVRHFGPTRFATGVWVGIELDEPEGKNDGSVDGVQYFACAAPGHGLFVRPERVVIAHHHQRSPAVSQQGYDEEVEEGATFARDDLEGQQSIRLGPGALSHVDARDLISAFRMRRDAQGCLSSNTFVEAFQSIEPRVSTQEALELFSAFDVDGSGALDAREFIPGALVLCGGEGEEKLQLSFHLLDFDQSGFLERAELENYVLAVFRIVKHAHPQVFEVNGIAPETLAAESVASALQSADRDADGRISLEEFREWMKTMAIGHSPAKGRSGTTVSSRETRSTAVSSSSPARTSSSRDPSSSSTKMTPVRPPAIPPSRPPVVEGRTNGVETSDVDESNRNRTWTEVQRWLVEEALVVLPFEQKATFEQFKDNKLTSLVRVARLTPTDINRLNLSFDLRLRLITAVRDLAKSLVFEASERKLHLSPLAKSQ